MKWQILKLFSSILFLPEFKSNLHSFLQGLSYGTFYVHGKNAIPYHHPFSSWFCYPEPAAMGLTLLEIREYILVNLK